MFHRFIKFYILFWLILKRTYSFNSNAHMAHYNKFNKIEMEIFKDGKVLEHNLWDDKGSEIREELVLFKTPEYHKGSRKLGIKLKNEVIRDLREKGLKTNFLLKCDIDKEGNVQNISITPKLDSKYEEQIINYFANLKGIEPGIIANMKVDYPWEIPFIIN